MSYNKKISKQIQERNQNSMAIPMEKEKVDDQKLKQSSQNLFEALKKAQKIPGFNMTEMLNKGFLDVLQKKIPLQIPWLLASYIHIYGFSKVASIYYEFTEHIYILAKEYFKTIDKKSLANDILINEYRALISKTENYTTEKQLKDAIEEFGKIILNFHNSL
jgi:hypothetical protein